MTRLRTPSADRIAMPIMRKCSVCRSLFAKRSMMHKVCGKIECAIAFAEQEKAKKLQRAAKVQRADIAVRKAALKTRSDHMKEAQIAFNAWVRARDYGMPCISCGKSSGAKINAGHYLSVGASPQNRFNPNNVHLQCEKCNSFLSGNISMYRPKLVDKIGLAAVEALEAMQEIHKWTIDELKAIKQQYKLKLKEMKNDNRNES